MKTTKRTNEAGKIQSNLQDIFISEVNSKYT